MADSSHTPLLRGGWDNNLDEACVHVIDQARYEQVGQPIPRCVDIDPHGRVRVVHSFATEICHGDLEERGQLLGVAGQSTNPQSVWCRIARCPRWPTGQRQGGRAVPTSAELRG